MRLGVCWCVCWYECWCVQFVLVAPFDLKRGRLNFGFCKEEAVFLGGEFFSAAQGTTT